MPRTRRGGRKYQLRKLVRELHLPATETRLPLGIEPADVQEPVSIYLPWRLIPISLKPMPSSHPPATRLPPCIKPAHALVSTYLPWRLIPISLNSVSSTPSTKEPWFPAIIGRMHRLDKKAADRHRDRQVRNHQPGT